MGKKNQLYGKWKRLLPNPDNDKEIYLVLEKDKAMDLKYIRQFENMFQEKDVIVTIVELIREKNKFQDEERKPDEKQIKTREESLQESKKKKKGGEPEIPEDQRHTSNWDVED